MRTGKMLRLISVVAAVLAIWTAPALSRGRSGGGDSGYFSGSDGYSRGGSDDCYQGDNKCNKEVAQVPEPMSLLLVGSGMIGFALWHRKASRG